MRGGEGRERERRSEGGEAWPLEPVRNTGEKEDRGREGGMPTSPIWGYDLKMSGLDHILPEDVSYTTLYMRGHHDSFVLKKLLT